MKILLCVFCSTNAGLDYRILSQEVLLADQQSKRAVPVHLVDDSLPETEERFRIRLTGRILGGAQLGSPTSCLVTIRASDDPYGAFGNEANN